MKLFLDFLPLILFFATFKYGDAHKDWAATFATAHFGFMVQGGKVGAEEAPVLLATVVVIIATLAQALITKLRGKKIDLMLWINLILVVVLGGLTIWLHNETFIKWKPSGLYWGMAATFWGSQAFFGRNLLKAMLGADLKLPEAIWRRLNVLWVSFFAASGFLNLWVAYHFSTAHWADFKVFGETALMFVFMLAQGFYLSRHIIDDTPGEETKDPEARLMSVMDEIEKRLRDALQPILFELQDDSAAHAGHAGAREGGHYSVSLVSASFTGLNKVARHRLVYHSLGELMHKGIHALVIHARAPGEP